MRSLSRKFEKLKVANPYLGDFIILRKAVLGRGFSKRIIDRYFNILVPSDDYERSDKKHLLENLYQATMPLRKVGNEPKNRSGEANCESMGISPP